MEENPQFPSKEVPCIEGEAGRHKVYSAQVCSEYKVEIGPRITTGQNDNNYISNI